MKKHWRLTPKGVEVEVRTEPAGAEVFIDGRRVGTSPCKFSLAVGKHKVTVRKKGYKEKTVEVSTPLKAPLLIKLEPLPVRVRLDSSPEGAKILLDGKDTGKRTPADFELPPRKIPNFPQT